MTREQFEALTPDQRWDAYHLLESMVGALEAVEVDEDLLPFYDPPVSMPDWYSPYYTFTFPMPREIPPITVTPHTTGDGWILDPGYTVIS